MCRIFSEELEQLMLEHEGCWVAVVDDAIVAVGNDPAEVLGLANKSGFRFRDFDGIFGNTNSTGGTSMSDKRRWEGSPVRAIARLQKLRYVIEHEFVAQYNEADDARSMEVAGFIRNPDLETAGPSFREMVTTID